MSDSSATQEGRNEKSLGGVSEEYSQLIEFIRAQKSTSGDEEGEDETRVVKKREFPAFWKTKEVRVNKHGEVEEVAQKVPASWLETDMLKGISEADVQKRRALFGYNELESPKENLLLKFIGFFRGPVLYVMELAVILAAGLRDWIDFGVIIAILLLNAFVGWYQEKQAGDIVAQLKAGIALRSTVVRDGHEVEIEARDLVPGDIVVIEDGKTVPCDGRVLAAYEDKDGSQAAAILEKARASRRADDDDDDEGVDKGPAIIACDQSAITGESLAVDKHIGDTVFYTTGCKRGKATFSAPTLPSRPSSVAPPRSCSAARPRATSRRSWAPLVPLCSSSSSSSLSSSGSAASSATPASPPPPRTTCSSTP